MEKILLLVDDEENIIKSLRRLFRQEPYMVLSANSGEDALKLLEENNVSVILSDQRMPGMVGSQFFKLVKEKHPNTIRIIMSGYTELESITSAINDGAVFKFLLKPWEDEKLLVHIRDAFSYFELKSINESLSKQLMEANKELEKRIDSEVEKNSLKTIALVLSQKILDSVPVAIFGISEDGMIVLANHHAHLITNNTALIGSMAIDIFPSEVVKYLELSIAASFEKVSKSFCWMGREREISIFVVDQNGAKCTCLSVMYN